MGVEAVKHNESDVKVKSSESATSCWNCFSSENTNLPPISLPEVRKEHRQKLKLYTFLASELLKPKAVSLKQTMREPYAIGKKIDEEIAKTHTNYDRNIVAQIETEQSTFEVYRKSSNKKDSEMMMSTTNNPNTPKDTFKSISHHIVSAKKSDEDVSHVYKVNIETPSIKVKRDLAKKLISSTPNTLETDVTVNEQILKKLETPMSAITSENKEPDEFSCNGSDSGYACSVVHGSSENNDTSDGVVNVISSREPTPIPNDLIKVTNLRKFEGSLPALSTTKDEGTSPIDASTYSLCEKSCEKKNNSKHIRWSTLSMCKHLYGDDEVFSETLSPGHATLPRRSNSPLPHERDLDRDRFPLNRSGLQTRSESMASVYSGAGEGTRNNVTVRGEVQFSLLYNYRLGALEVGVRRCRDLAAVDTKRNRSDPYVKVYLLPDKSKAGKRKTKVKKNTLNPVFEETLSFVQPLASLSSRTLWLSVWHADMFGRNDFLGEVTLPLADVVFDDPAPTWHKLHERTEQFDEQQGTRGDLIIGLKFELQDSNPSRGKGTLHVLVKEAKNLVATKPNGLADAFCKSYLLPERGRLAKQKTGVSRRSLNPRWEHTFTYRGLTMQELATRALELSIWDRDRLASNDFMGAVRLSLGTGTYMGASVNWMDSVGKEVALWQTMMQRPNFWVEGSLPLRPQLNN